MTPLEHAPSFKTYKKPFSTRMMILNLSEDKNYKIKRMWVKELVSSLFEHQETEFSVVKFLLTRTESWHSRGPLQTESR